MSNQTEIKVMTAYVNGYGLNSVSAKDFTDACRKIGAKDAKIHNSPVAFINTTHYNSSLYYSVARQLKANIDAVSLLKSIVDSVDFMNRDTAAPVLSWSDIDKIKAALQAMQ